MSRAEFNRRFPAWLMNGLCWMWMGLMVGWAFTSMVYELHEPEGEQWVEQMKRDGYRIVKQGAQPAVGDDAR